ncbi:Magnesium transporter protein-like protein [Hapsidospora chrysogenum ATCC 11550]|uniref:Magnesium transporter protein-like protein n=1 Tax=Hapsidospora chrysogenum (strain ATCC 11550 / CBS 779.69 / DSM 880 / IAM 14645 / JCM 23072 / IMI 49137) TaxID=857340 RepID=A0A086TBV6_HAPC1|nr:Magnesium transporter protein-like protein [Hapsidospora chrysogenum ATCC 11550]
MRFLQSVLSATLLVAGAFAAKKSSAERFQDFHTKSKSSVPLKLSETTYKSLTSTPRDYSAAVLLTALEARFGCQLCQEFQPQYDVLSKSWAKGDPAGDSRLLFSTLDFVDGRDIFVSLGLQTAPVLLLFPPTEGPHAVASKEPLRYDFTTGNPTAEQVHAWLSRHLPDRPHPPVKRPINWMRWGSGITIILGAVTVLVTASPYVLPVLQNRKIWTSISLVSILLFTSGHMFNQIRKAPYVAGDGRGGISYFAGSFQNQYGIETQVVAVLYGILAVCATYLAVKVPQMADARSQQVAVLASSGILLVVYSFLLSIFRIKNGGYPFSIPPFM